MGLGMRVQTAENRQAWDSWLEQNTKFSPFAQSWEWGDLSVKEGLETERIVISEEDDKIAQAQIVYTKLFFGRRYAFCPRGPVIAEQNLAAEAYEALSNYLKGERCIFFRFEPEILDFPLTNGKKTIDINPPATLVLDLSKSEQELLLGMHQKTRYNIHLAEKKEVRVEDKKDFDVFYGLMKKTGARDEFRLHPERHYKQVLSSPLVHQLTAYSGGTAVAAAIFVGFGNTCTYLYGASDYAYRSLMVPYLLQWRAIQFAKKSGYGYYDFFGVAPRIAAGEEYVYDKKHRYAGVTRFKLGFGGFERQTAGTYDLILDKSKYSAYMLLRRLRRMV